MNKQELIEKYKSALNKVHKVYGDYYKTEAYEEVLKDLKRLDEPKKVTVPQFVANWYEEHKDVLEFHIWDYVYRFDMQEDTSFKKWFNEPKTEPFKTLVNMHQFGYTVEKEKRYYVRLKNVDENYNYLTNIKHLNAWALTEIKTDKKFRSQHTRQELEGGGFGEVFNSPLFEVEEVGE